MVMYADICPPGQWSGDVCQGHGRHVCLAGCYICGMSVLGCVCGVCVCTVMFGWLAVTSVECLL